MKYLSGLQKICKAHGRMKIQGVMWVWDYAADCPVLESEMMADRDRWAKSERVKWGKVTERASPAEP